MESDKVKMATAQLKRLKNKVKSTRPEKESEENRTWGSGANYDGRHRAKE